MIAHKKPFSSIATNGHTQDTDACKALLQSTPGQWFPDGTPGEGWKRVTKYGKSPAQYRIFKNSDDVHALVIETPQQLAVVGIDVDADTLKNATLSDALLTQLGATEHTATSIPRPKSLADTPLNATIASMKSGASIRASVQTLMTSMRSNVPRDAWLQMLHIEDQFTSKQVKDRAKEIQDDLETREASNFSEAMYNIITELGFGSSRKKNYTAEDLLNRKAIASLFAVTEFYNGNGDSDSEGAKPSSYRDDEMLGVFLEHPWIEPDQSPSMDILFDQSFEELNGSCDFGINPDPSVADLDGIVDTYTKTYVWLIERGFQTPNAPASAKKMVKMRKELRENARIHMKSPSKGGPNP